MELQTVQVVVFLLFTAVIGLATYIKCRGTRVDADSNKEYFLAGGGLSWIFVAGSITLTNISTDQLVGMNGNQMALLAWWEFAAVAGLIILAKVFLPVYYRNNCTTTTELLEKRYNDHHIRATVSIMFLLGNIFIFLPAMLYGGSLFMQSMFGIDVSIMVLATMFAVIGACYAIFGGLRAVAVSDTYSGVVLLGMGVLVVFLALQAINYDFSGIPAERLTLIGSNHQSDPLAYPADRDDFYPDFLLEHQPDNYPARDGFADAERGPERRFCRSRHPVPDCATHDCPARNCFLQALRRYR